MYYSCPKINCIPKRLYNKLACESMNFELRQKIIIKKL